MFDIISRYLCFILRDKIVNVSLGGSFFMIKFKW